jgi:hypothetical protein
MTLPTRMLIGFLVAVGYGPSLLAADARRPNILFIIADDQSPFDLKAYDPASRLETPVIDSLAAREAAGDHDPFLIYDGFSHPHDTRDDTPDLLAKYGATNHTDQTCPPPRHEAPPLPANWLPAQAVKRRELEALLLAEMQRHDDPYRFSDQPAMEAAR